VKPLLVALSSGTLFGAGLALSNMTNPAKVQAFLDVAGAWDPSLAFVMGAAVAVSAVAVRLHGARAAAASGVDARLLSIDARLLSGAALFGLGWGLTGLCPGPTIAALVSGSSEIALFAAAMLAGMALHHFLAAGRGSREADSRPQPVATS